MEGRELRHDRHKVSLLTDRIIDMAVNVDHVHFFVKCPPKYSVGYIAKRIKERSSRELRKAFLHLEEWCEYWTMSAIQLTWLGLSGIECRGEIYTESGECKNAMYKPWT
jgi:hypothetical protein